MVQLILAKFLKDAGPKVLQAKFDKAVPKIVVGMRSKGLSPETASLKVLVRDALFRLWRVVIPSGDLADFVRDHQAGAVVKLVGDRLTGGDAGNLTKIVQATASAAVEVAFD